MVNPNSLKYSDGLLKRFKAAYQNNFDERISSETAESELSRLARLVEILFSDYSGKETKNDVCA